MPCDPNLLSSAYYTFPYIIPFLNFFVYLYLVLFLLLLVITLDIEHHSTNHYNKLLGLVSIRSKGLMKQLYFPGAKPIQLHSCALTSTCTNIHTCTLTWLVWTDDIRTETVNEEILPGRRHISMQQIHQLLYVDFVAMACIIMYCKTDVHQN